MSVWLSVREKKKEEGGKKWREQVCEKERKMLRWIGERGCVIEKGGESKLQRGNREKGPCMRLYVRMRERKQPREYNKQGEDETEEKKIQFFKREREREIG